MKPDGVLKHFIVAFLLALVGYVFFYLAIEHRRVAKGPWVVTFARTTAGAPRMTLEQQRLGIANVQVEFPGERVPEGSQAGTWRFDRVRAVPYPVPFGECVFMDSTFLPGTVTFRMFGHEIELLPRVLIIDHQEHRWISGDRVVLTRSANSGTALP